MDERTATSEATLTSGRRLVRNVIWNGLGEVGPLAAAVVAMPILVHELGTERFGIVALAWTVFAYFSLFDLGISSALTKLASDRLATRQGAEIPALLGTSLILTAALGLMGALLCGWLAPYLVNHVFKIAPSMRPETIQAFTLLAIALPICATSNALVAVLSAYQRFDLINLVQSPNAIYSSLAPLAVLPFSHSIVPIIGVLVVGHAVTWVVYFAMCVRAVPRLVRQIEVRPKLIPELVRFGAWVATANLAGLAGGTFDRFVLASMVSMSAVAYYVIPSRILHKLRLIPGFVGKVMFPALSYEILDNRVRARILFERGVKAVALIMFPVTLILVGFGRELMTLWVGAGFAAYSAPLLSLLAIAAFFESLSRVPGSLMWAAHRPDLSAKILTIAFPIYLAFMLVMVYLYGAEGAAIACAVRSGTLTVVSWIVVRAVIPDVAHGARRLVLFSLAMCAGFVLAAIPFAIETRIWIVASELVVLAAIAWRGLLGPEDREMALQLIGNLRKAAAVRLGQAIS